MKSIKLQIILFFIIQISSLAQVQNYVVTSDNGYKNDGICFTGKTDGTTTGVLYEFRIEGANPSGSLVQGTDGNFYGMCTNGGANSDNVDFGGYGSIFKITSSGYMTPIWSLSTIDGIHPQGSLAFGNDGDFYGMSSEGGSNNYGTIFKITTSGTFTKLWDLSTLDGINPNGSLVQSSNGDFYGMCIGGGTKGYGTIFKITTLGVFTKLRDLNSSTDGSSPNGDLALGTDGNFYGMCFSGGSNGNGTIFKMTTSGIFTKLRDFNSLTDGSLPTGSLIESADGFFYGMCSSGGVSNSGSIFKITSSGVFTKLKDFGGFGSLKQGIDGNFYGLAGSSIFKINSDGNYTNLYNLDYWTEGGRPYGNLIQGDDGNFYGMCPHGGNISDNGTIFKITPNGIFTKLCTLNHGDNGASPTNLLLSEDGNFYGICNSGGIYADYYGGGIIFKITPAGDFTKLKDFNPFIDGSSPTNVLTQGSDGNFYGMCTHGGTHNEGTIFKISPTGVFTKLRDLFDYTDGRDPYGSLVEGNDGNFYGMCNLGGVNDNINGIGLGTIFKISPNGTYTKLRDLSTIDGIFPTGSMVKGADGDFYGMCTSGANNMSEYLSESYGTIFKITSTGSFTKLWNFSTIDGINPMGSLIQGSDGYFYGTCSKGGANGYGTIFKITSNGVLTKLWDLSSIDGISPQSNLVEGTDGYFYGTCSQGGANGYGTIFKINTAGSFTKFRDMSSYQNIGTPNILLLNDFSQTIIGFNPITPQNFGSPPFLLSNVISSSGLPVTFTSSNLSVAVVNNNSINLLSPGVTTITAFQAGNNLIGGAIPISQVLTVTCIPIIPTVTLTSNISEAVCSGTNIGFTATGANAGSNPVYSLLRNGIFVTSGTGSVFNSTILTNGDQVSIQLKITSAGCFATTTTLSNIYVATVNPITYILAQPVSQTITAGTSTQFELSVIGMNLNYQWSKNMISINGTSNNNILTCQGAITDAGNYQATVSGTCGNAVSDIAILTVNKLSQSITGFNSINNIIISGVAQTLIFTSTSTSGLPINFSLNTIPNNIATLNGNILTIVDIGLITVTASQVGNTNYNAAPNVSFSFSVTTLTSLGVLTTTIPGISTTPGIVFTNTSSILHWRPVPEAISYCIELATDDTFGILIYSVCGITDTFYVLPSRLFSQSRIESNDYYWRVAATFGSVQGDWSKTGSFLFSSVTEIDQTIDTHSIFEVYPNPSTGSFKIIFINHDQLNNCKVYNTLGQHIATLKSGEAVLPSGLYLLTAGNQIKKLVIE